MVNERRIFAYDTMHEICIDMDGVAVDLDAYFHRLFGQSLWHMDKDEKNRHWDELFEPKWFLEAPMMPDFPLLLSFITTNFQRRRFLTALPNKRRDMAWQSMEMKTSWTHTNVGHHVPVTFGPYAEDKQKHCGGPTYVLIDDSIKNIEQWGAVGGIAIHHISAAQTIESLKSLLVPIGIQENFRSR